MTDAGTKHEGAVGWHVNDQKLIVLMVLDDEIGNVVSCGTCGEGFFRAFIVEDRETAEIGCNFRFRYAKGDSWYRIGPSLHSSRAERVAELEEGMRLVLRTALAGLLEKAGAAPEVPENIITSYFPPDDEGDGMNTVAWLLEKDLMRVREDVRES